MITLRHALVVVAIASSGCRDASTAVATEVVTVTAVAETSDYEALVKRLDRVIDARAFEADAHASWRREAALANALLARADLTGDYADYEGVETHLARAFELARAGSGPHLLRARFHLRMHRVAEAREDLATLAAYATKLEDSERARVGLLADIAMNEGRYKDALAAFG
ncbi:MAG TPA: hypothetical protein VFG69_03395, partial [Nannocystaceae bacterium]|nr:hypothetical protein [Nannocystaceae bacterium]